jgi:TetR/AcrR family transcriptional repressor of nem operon
MSTGTSTKRTDTADRTLDIAERLVQIRGFNGFSYADVARELGITKASLHYHFPGKAELGEALITRYGSRFAQALTEIDHAAADARAKLDAYVGIYRAVLSEGRMCLCGILAAEYETLPDRMRDAVTRFFEVNEAWLAAVLSQGQSDGSLKVTGSLPAVSEMILSSLEGAMLISRAHRDPARFTITVDRLLDTLTPR